MLLPSTHITLPFKDIITGNQRKEPPTDRFYRVQAGIEDLGFRAPAASVVLQAGPFRLAHRDMYFRVIHEACSCMYPKVKGLGLMVSCTVRKPHN